MKKLVVVIGFALALSPTARAQVGVQIDIVMPVAPQVVEVEPGVRVVEGVDEEVFYSGGWYWCRRGDGWYRARSPRAHFFWVDRHRVPRAFARMPEGRYRNWRRADHPEWHGPRGERGGPAWREPAQRDRGHEPHPARPVAHEGAHPPGHEGHEGHAVHHEEHHDEHH
jgi:hypothetical protein